MEAEAPERHFLGWDRPVLERAADFLLARRDREGLALERCLVVVPTRNAGRRLREMLANLSAEEGAALMPPLVVPPTFLARPDLGARRLGLTLADEAESLCAWIHVLTKLEPDAVSVLYPAGGRAHDFTWAKGAAADLMELRSLLGEAGRSFEDVSRLLEDDHRDAERWRELAALETQYLKALRRLDRCDGVVARRAAARHPEVPPEVESVIVIAAPDPFPLALEALKRLATRTQVEVVVAAPESEAACFDAWGQPLPEFWEQATLALSDFEERVTLCPTPEAQIEHMASLAASSPEPELTLGLGILDPAEASLVERGLRARGLEVYAPAGRKLAGEGWMHFLCALEGLAKSGSREAVADLLRAPELHAVVRSQWPDWAAREALRVFDDRLERNLPVDLEAMMTHVACPALDPALELLKQWQRDLRSKPLHHVLPSILATVYRERRWEDGGADGTESLKGRAPREVAAALRAAERWPERVAGAAADPLFRVLESLRHAGERGLLQDRDEKALSLLVDLLARQPVPEERGSQALELQGWLELLWEDAPHLVVSGCNDHLVPESVTGHAYLPEGLRCHPALGLKSNRDRFARDAYLLHAMAKMREAEGRLDLILVRRNRVGDPLRPSRLLFRCEDAALPRRVEILFDETRQDAGVEAWAPGFRLRPDPPGVADEASPETIDRIAVTGFKTYLQSPFHYYVQRVRRARAVSVEKREWDAGDFGTFCHRVLEAFGRNEEARQSTDADEIAAFLMREAEMQARKQLGDRPPTAVRLQLRAAEARLQAAARQQAALRQEGWEIVDVEGKLEEMVELSLAGLRLTGRVDRIDRRGEAVRIIDYKCGNSVDPPERAHWSRSVGEPSDWPPDYALFEIKGKPHRWKDLQLPLYALALRGHWGENTLETGYFCLPKVIGETGFQPLAWDGSLEEDARRCADGVAGDVAAGRFLPLKPTGIYDDLAALHLGAPERCLDLSGFETREASAPSI